MNDAGVSYTAIEIVEETPKVATLKGSTGGQSKGKKAAAKPVGKPTGFWSVTINSSEFSDCSIFKGAPISRLTIGNTAVTDLTPLIGLPLDQLRLYNTKVADLRPLEGMALTVLHVSGTPVADISVVRGMPLTHVRLHACKALTDVSPLAGAKDLTSLTLPPNAQNYEFLRDRSKIPKLERLGFEYDPKIFLPDKTVAEFWKDYDAKKRAETKQP